MTMPPRLVPLVAQYDHACERLLRRHAGTMYDPNLVELFVTKHLGALYRDDVDEAELDQGVEGEPPQRAVGEGK